MEETRRPAVAPGPAVWEPDTPRRLRAASGRQGRGVQRVWCLRTPRRRGCAGRSWERVGDPGEAARQEGLTGRPPPGWQPLGHNKRNSS